MDGSVLLQPPCLWRDDVGHVIAVESLRSAVLSPGFNELAQDHYREIANYQDKVPLAPRWRDYDAEERAGNLVCITLREHGSLIGYASFLLTRHLHYASLKPGINDLLFLRKDKRNGLLGFRFIKECENHLKRIGVNKYQWHVKPGHDFGLILERLGYLKEEHVYGKIL